MAKGNGLVELITTSEPREARPEPGGGRELEKRFSEIKRRGALGIHSRLLPTNKAEEAALAYPMLR